MSLLLRFIGPLEYPILIKLTFDPQFKNFNNLPDCSWFYYHFHNSITSIRTIYIYSLSGKCKFCTSLLTSVKFCHFCNMYDIDNFIFLSKWVHIIPISG